MAITTVHHPFLQFVDTLKENHLVWQGIIHICQQYSINKNSLLYCLWVGVSQHGRLRQFHLKKIDEVVNAWNKKITKELSALEASWEKYNVSANLRKSAHEIKEGLVANMAYSEWVEKNMLIDALSQCKQFTRNPRQQLGDACFNLVSYLKFLKIGIKPAEQQVLQIILQAIFATLSGPEVTEALDQAIAAQKLHCTQLPLSCF